MLRVRILALLAAVGVTVTAAILIVMNTSRPPTASPSPIPSASASAQRPAVPRFVEEAASAGLRHAYDGDFEYFVGGGVAVLDCNDDRLPDLYIAGGSEPAALYRN